jgi:hypothetical protein
LKTFPGVFNFVWKRAKNQEILADNFEKYLYYLPDLPDVPAFVENSRECRQQGD